MSTITIPYNEYRTLRRAAKRVAQAKQRKVQALARKAYWSRIYWAQALRFETFKIGGLRFIKLGSISISVCITKPQEG